MDEFASIRADLSRVSNLSELERAAGVSRKHLQRIRDGVVDNTTLRTIRLIRAGLVEVERARKANAKQHA